MANEQVRLRWAGMFDEVLIDEYQDTNLAQYTFARLLCREHRRLFVVGDDSQSIYSFRAASVGNILAFPRQFAPPAAVVTIEQNYRSTAPILDAANAVIALATEGYEKRLFSARPRIRALTSGSYSICCCSIASGR